MKSLSQHINESFINENVIYELRPIIDIKNVDVNRAGYIKGQLGFDKKLGWVVFYNDMNNFSYSVETYLKLSKSDIAWAESIKWYIGDRGTTAFGFKIDKNGDATIEHYDIK